jgi:hypothetical protein
MTCAGSITGPGGVGPSILKTNTEPLKRYVLGKLGYPNIKVEITDGQLEDIIRVSGDFIAMYFPREQKIGQFYTIPLQATYPMPDDAWWIEEVSWDPYTAKVDDIFGADYYLLNYGNFVGPNSMVLDYHMLQSYRRHSAKILGVEGRWEVIGEVEGNVVGDQLDAAQQRIRLIPTPKAAFPVVVVYLPCINNFRSPQARKLAYDYVEAEARIAVGMARRKIQGVPTPDGGTLTYDGESLVKEGEELKEKTLEQALLQGEPLGIIAT